MDAPRRWERRRDGWSVRDGQRGCVGRGGWDGGGGGNGDGMGWRWEREWEWERDGLRWD